MSETKETLVQRVALQTIILRRNGQQFVPAIGDVVELTTSELEQINATNPSAIGHIKINQSVAKALVEKTVDMEAIKREALEQARAELAAEQAKSAETAKSNKKGAKAKTDADDDL